MKRLKGGCDVIKASVLFSLIVCCCCCSCTLFCLAGHLKINWTLLSVNDYRTIFLFESACLSFCDSCCSIIKSLNSLRQANLCHCCLPLFCLVWHATHFEINTNLHIALFCVVNLIKFHLFSPSIVCISIKQNKTGKLSP